MKKFSGAVAAVLSLAAAVAAADAASYPERPVKMIVPWAAGGDTDVIYRAFAPYFQKAFGQPVIIANVGGASGTVGEREAATATADGYTIFAPHDYVHSVYYAGLTDIRYDQAFEPICLVASTPSVITASAKAPWKSYQEMIADAKAHPGTITVGASLGSTSQYSIALAAKAAGVTFKYVPYDGTAPRMNALLGGHIQLADSNLTQKGKVDAGLLNFLAVMTEKRNPELPNVPTLKELGYDVEYAVNRGIMVPKGTPAEVKQKLGSACAAAAKAPEFAKAMALQGTEVRYMDAAEYAAFLKKDDAVTKDITKDLGLLKPRVMIGRDGIAGLVCLAISAGLLWLTRGLPPAVLVPLGPAVYPRVILGLTAALSATLIVQDLMARRRARAGVAQAAAAAERPNYPLVLATFALFGCYVAVLPELGFRISTALFVGALQVTLEWPRSWRRWLLVLLVAVGTTLVCQLVFEDYLSVLLPRGRWSGL